MIHIVEEAANRLANRQCTVCDSKEHITESWGKGGLNDVCRACFFIWLDGGVDCKRPEHDDQTPHIHGEDIRIYCLNAKAEGKWPFNGSQLS